MFPEPPTSWKVPIRQSVRSFTGPVAPFWTPVTIWVEPSSAPSGRPGTLKPTAGPAPPGIDSIRAIAEIRTEEAPRFTNRVSVPRSPIDPAGRDPRHFCSSRSRRLNRRTPSTGTVRTKVWGTGFVLLSLQVSRVGLADVRSPTYQAIRLTAVA